MMYPKNSVLRICIPTPVYQNKTSSVHSHNYIFLSACGADIIHVSLDSSANLHFELRRQIVIHHPHDPHIWGVEDDRQGSQSMVRISGWGQSQTQQGQKSRQFFLSEQLTCIIHLYCGPESIFHIRELKISMYKRDYLYHFIFSHPKIWICWVFCSIQHRSNDSSTYQE